MSMQFNSGNDVASVQKQFAFPWNVELTIIIQIHDLGVAAVSGLRVFLCRNIFLVMLGRPNPVYYIINISCFTAHLRYRIV